MSQIRHIQRINNISSLWYIPFSFLYFLYYNTIYDINRKIKFFSAIRSVRGHIVSRDNASSVRYAYIHKNVKSEIIISWVSFRDCVYASRASLGQVREYARHTVEIMKIGQHAMHRCVQPRRWRARRGSKPPRGEKQRIWGPHQVSFAISVPLCRPKTRNRVSRTST